MGKFTGIRFYLREKKKWSNFLKLHAGFDASFVLDKTTDSANVSFICATEPTFLKINTWVVLFINADTNVVEFNWDGTPSNHEQFIVGGYQYYKTLAGWEVSMKLVEPIERFRGVLGETLSYTNQTSKVQNGTTYVKEPYNYYTALKRWLQVTPANTDNISRDSDRKDTNGIAWWNRITILDQSFLEGLSFADDTFNELSLYDLLFDVYDSGTGRTPVAYFDLDKETKLARNNARDEYLLKFIVQDGTDKPIVEWNDLVAHKPFGEICTGVMKREDGANYATGLVSNVTNLSPSTTAFFPAQGFYAVPEALNATTRGTTDLGAGAENWGLRLPYKIKHVVKLEKMEVKGYKLAGDVQVKLQRRIADKIVKENKERDAWLQVSEIEYFYNEGDNIVYLNDYKYEKPNDYDFKFRVASWLYRIEYVPLIDARICVGDSEYVQQINQTATQVDSDKFGKFMGNYLAGMGKADYTIQRTTEKPQDYINLIGSRVKRDGKMFMITNVAFRNRNFQYDVFFQLNENHLRKNMSYQAPQNIRSNTAIQYDNISDRRTNFDVKLSMGLKPVERLANLNKIIPNTAVVLNIFGVNCDESFFPQAANITNKFVLKSQDASESKANDEEFTIPIIRFSTNNQVSINIQFYDNATAGVKREVEKKGSDPFYRVNNQIPVLYTDPFGEVSGTKIELVNVAGGAFFDIDAEALQDYDDNYNYVLTEFNRTLNMQNATATPKGHASVNKLVLSSNNFINLQKDMHEKYNITFTMLLDGGEVIVFENDALQYSRLISSQNEFKAWRLEFVYNDHNWTDYQVFLRSDLEPQNNGSYRPVKVSGNSKITYDYSHSPLTYVPNMIYIYMKEENDGFINGIKVATIYVDNANLTEEESEKLKTRLDLYF